MLSKMLLDSIFRRGVCFRHLVTSARCIPYPKIDKFGSKQDVEEYKSALSDITADVTESFKDLPICAKRLAEVIDYSFADQPHYTGFMVPIIFRMFEIDSTLTAKEVKASNILGRCTDMIFLSCQIADDIIDGSVVKLGKPCLYKKNDIGMNALIYSRLVNKSIFLTLKKYFQNHPNYLPLFELMHLVWTYLTYGQVMDMESTVAEFSLQLYTKNRFINMMTFKSTYTAFYLPIIGALHLSNKYNERLCGQVKKFSDLMGMYYAAQNDMVDCYPDSSKRGTVGTDIKKGKCTWLIVKALELATDEQKKILEKHYRRDNPESEWKVRKVYQEMDMLSLFLNYERECISEAKKQVEEFDDILKEPLKMAIKIVSPIPYAF